jgi:hypothetical protein
MSIKESRDEWSNFGISSLFKSKSYRILLKGDFSLVDDEDGNKIAKLKRDENGELKEYKLQFQKPTYDGSGEIYPVIQKLEEGNWVFHVIDAESLEDERITNSVWNKAGRRNEIEKVISPEKLNEHAGGSIRIVIKTEPDKDMPKKANSSVELDPDSTLTIVVQEVDRIKISAIEIPSIPQEGNSPDGS